MPRKLRTEHAGAKNGGGYWGPRQEAKETSKRQRRIDSQAIIHEQQNEPPELELYRKWEAIQAKRK